MAHEGAPIIDRRGLDTLAAEHRALAACVDDLEAAVECIVAAAVADHFLFLAGNGGSLADALHIAGELKKSFEHRRPLPPTVTQALVDLGADELAAHLDQGLRVVVLGADPVLSSAADNDLGLPHIGAAQELLALGREGDVLLVLSTSGRSTNVTYAATVARALGMGVVVLTGEHRTTPLLELADVVVRAPGATTGDVQGNHSLLYHALCRTLEDTLFPTEG